MSRTLLQYRDLFFISIEFYEQHIDSLKNQIVVPIEEFKTHTEYNTIHANCCYKIWQIDYNLVIVALAGWYERQDSAFQKEIYYEQLKNHSNMVNNDSLITINYWLSLSDINKNILIHKDEEQIEISLTDDNRFSELNGCFPHAHGGNCFATTMYGMTGNVDLLNEWMHQKTFQEMLKRNDYSEVGKIKKESVLVFHDIKFQHACYVIDASTVFNKSGQTFWNPWHVTTIEKVVREWSHLDIKIFNKSE